MILLDTHAWFWWLSEPEQLSKPAQSAIDDAEIIGISAICAWEMGMLWNRRRISVKPSPAIWVSDALRADPRIRELPLDAATAIRAASLERDVSTLDPADLFLISAAIQYDAKLVTKDKKLHAYDPERTIW